MCDVDHTFQVLTNLVANACRHGGLNIAIVLDGDATLAHCRVIDDGEGVDDQMEGFLFSRLGHDGTEALTRKSLGLGTWVARELARAMGGDITYQRKGSLTVFHLSLPQVEVEAWAAAGQPSVSAGR
jgi:signal transduction histidine kinase